MIVTDQRSRIFEINQSLEKITGYCRDEVIGRNLSFLGSDRHDPGFYLQILETLHIQDHWRGEIWSRSKNGEVYPVWLSLSVIRIKIVCRAILSPCFPTSQKTWPMKCIFSTWPIMIF
ncbi:MAG: PAS domain S-box protein [Candidatus Competibacteraceae bacterium]|nr:PAS domain S-box protein [Candidatus Competibacteraceae bacterium]